MLIVKNLEIRYKETDFVLKNINLKIARGEMTALLGENGTGKSTILKVIAGLEEYSAGEILLNGKSYEMLQSKERSLFRQKVPYIFQDSNLLDNKTAFYHLALVYKIKRQRADKDRIDRVLDILDLSKYKDTKTRNLSGGQRQKLSIAISLLYDPDLLLCDEISSALDKASEDEIYNLLGKIKEDRNCSVLLVTHNINVVKQHCDRAYFIKKSGEIVELDINQSQNEPPVGEFFRYVRGYLER